MNVRLTIAILSALALAACEPKAEELDGAPSGPKNGELAGGLPVQQIVLPGVINLTAPAGTQVIPDCEKIVAPDYDTPPNMTCLLFLVDEPAPAAHSEETDSAFLRAMKSSGWEFVRATGAERYFERAKQGTDCADLAAVVVLEDQLTGLTAQAKAGDPPIGSAWLAYAIPASIREACGADRMKP